MRIEEVVLSAERKHNLGNYENIGFFSSIKIRCDSTETLASVTKTIGEQFPVILEDLKRQFDDYEQKRHNRFRKQADQLIEESEKERAEEPPHQEVEP